MKPSWTAIAAKRQICVQYGSHSSTFRHNTPQRCASTCLRAQFPPVLSRSSISGPQSWQAFFTATSSTQNLNRPTDISIRSFSSSSAVRNSTEQHKATVKQISKTVRGYFKRGEKFRIFHGSTNSTRPGIKRNLVDTSTLSNVLNVDVKKKTCLVEPNVPMDRLVEATLKHGLVPPVVMEFPGITVGGGYSGTSGESSSFKHGFFDRTINSVEMVLADGEVTTISPTEKPDLFNGAAGAVGTFGVTTLVELQLQDAKKYVETTYHPVTSMKEAIQKLQSATTDPSLDYIDGIMYSPTSGAIITGRLTDTHISSLPIQTFSKPWDPWFYLHVQTHLSSGPVTELIPLPEYLFRYDRGGFWVGASAFKYFKFPFNRFTRWFLDDFLHTRMMYTALHASGQSKRYIVQDLALPYTTAEEFVEYTDAEFGIWPLWLCPLKQNPAPTMHPHYKAPDGSLPQMLNIGLWGDGPDNPSEFIAKNRDLEQKLKELGGMKWFYAHTYYDEKEFWGMFDKGWYEALRKKYKAEGLTSVYEKVRVDVGKEVEEKSWRTRWPWSGFYGIWKAIQSKSYVAARASEWKKYGR
ncbi:FAD-binding protein [Glarea lozoyensis ATCC 20868]|uniref:Delta(24)-sterol reductase n=1 Tax=Glarea lozoyensis (strain ATCC 20868 / MF5171) TaxID=1116229 RepID=S3DUY1_GLAL2|nr:FAD-binding protein [Glarea lozoyensis ATCC 20868]EPE30213.1 FAD-binding protein [Glarea lozoyensis ATCC 20868]